MNDASPKKRPRFQLHLSTCVVLMGVAGALVWANIAYYRNFDRVYNQFNLPDAPPPIALIGYFGVPLFSVLCLILTAFACEYAVRRRARKPQDPTP